MLRRPRLLWLSAFLLLSILFASNLFSQCGVERWSVKTGTDSTASQVNLSSSTNTTIAAMRALTPPSPIPSTSRVAPTETTVWVMNATLTQYKLEGDSDYHLIIRDGSGNTMIAEIPSPSCVGSGSPFLPGIQNSRSEFNARYTPTTSFQTANIPVQVMGVGMFDFLHGQTGVAPNGIELHPVLDVIFNPGQSPDFGLGASPGTLSVPKGSSGTSTISTSAINGFSSAIFLSASGMPSGVTASFSPTSISAPGTGSSTLTLSASSSAVIGTNDITVTANGGGVTHTTTVSLSVTQGGGGTTTQLLGNAGFENGSSNPAPWVTTPGVINNSASEPPHSGSWDAWLDGYGTTHTDTLMQQVSIPTNATTAALSFWLHIDTAETGTSAFDTLAVQVRDSSGSVLQTLATYSNLDAAPGYQQKAFDLISYSGQTIQINFVGQEDASNQTSFVLDDTALDVTTPGGGSPPTTSVTSPADGSTVSGSVSITATASDSVGVTMMEIYIDGALKTSNTNSTTLSYAWDTTSVANGLHNIFSRAYNAAGGVGTSSTVTVTVSNPTGTPTELIVNGGFENGSNPAPWTTTAGVVTNSTLKSPHSGSWYAWLDGYGTTHTDTVMQQLTVPSNATAATLSFWLHIDTAETTTTIAYDRLMVQVRNSSGTVVVTLATYSNLNAAPGYQQRTFDLTSYRGQTIQIYMTGTEDYTRQTSFVVDDVSLQVLQ